MKNRIFQERKNLLFLKESLKSDLIEEMTNEQKQRTIENMIIESQEILNPIEMKTLMAFTRSKLNRKENKKQIARILQVSVRQIKKIKRQGRKKLMIKPLNLLIKQSEIRMKRFYRLGKPQGQGDLDLAIFLLERAYRMADLLCFLDQK